MSQSPIPISVMLNQESNTVIVYDKMLLILYNIDVKLNEVFKCSSDSFKKSSTFFRSSFKPLQTHRNNVNKLIHLPNVSGINSENIKDSITLITAELQFHDVMEQRLKHIRQIHNEMIQEIITQKKSPSRKNSDESYIHVIAKINTAQVDHIHNEYTTYCKKIDESLGAIKKYLSDWHKIAPALSGTQPNADALSIIQQNSDLANRVIGFIKGFEDDLSFRQIFSKHFGEIIKSLNSLSSLATEPTKASTDHTVLRRLESMYTTDGEREVFNKITNTGTKIRKSNSISQSESGVDLF